jgi:hypothetical protein
MILQDTLKLIVDFKNTSPASSNYTPILTVIISGVFSIILAYATSKFTRKKELDRIKEHNEQLEYSVKQALLSIESDNYKRLYELKLKALKEIKEISFNKLERNPNNFSELEDFLFNFPFSEIMGLIHVFIIDYSYIFKDEITSLLKEIYHDCEYADNNMGQDSHDLADHAEAVYDNFKRLISYYIV